jgi:hypothetical protein
VHTYVFSIFTYLKTFMHIYVYMEKGERLGRQSKCESKCHRILRTDETG